MGYYNADYGSASAAAENRRMREQADLSYKAASAKYLQEISIQITDLRNVIAEVRNMLETLVGITKYSDRTAYNQYLIQQKADSMADNDG